jgi:hypothetical protein
MAKRRTARKTWFSKLKYLILLLTGSGAGLGSYHYRDTLLGRVVEKASETPEGARIKALVAEKINTALKKDDGFSKPGVFEVRVSQVVLDPEVFKPGHRVGMEVVVHKVAADGKKKTVWDSKPFGQRIGIAGQNELSAYWEDRPFEVAWGPGDKFLVEVFDRNGIWSTKIFEMTEDEADSKDFPLKSGTHPITFVSKGPKPADPEASKLVLTSRRISDLPGSQGRQETGAKAVARGDDDTITIK